MDDQRHGVAAVEQVVPVHPSARSAYDTTPMGVANMKSHSTAATAGATA